MTDTRLSRGGLLKLVLLRFGLGFVVLSLLLFLPAGTLGYWQAWLWLFTLFTPMVFVLIYLLRNDPDLLERRMHMRETQKTQKRVVQFGGIFLLLPFVIPGFDQRFDWSQVPAAIVIAADVLMFLSYCLFIWVMRENSYASRVIEVEKGQKVSSSGPYAIIRHPMYLAAIGIYVFTPLVLASYWAVIPTALIIPMLVVRILNEEKVLTTELPGYEEYLRKVRYRLIPGLW
jgi:protein-S-isoprenylcysteine O-methyltransferase Ste14